MKVFLINLKTQKNRLDFMTEQLNKYNIEFERIDAVVGKDLTDEEIRLTNSRFLQWCYGGRVLKRGEIGCALSHMKIWQRIVDENILHACILEDDVTVLPEITKTLSMIDETDDQNECCAYQISMNEKEGGTIAVNPGVYDIKDAQHTCGYILNPKSAKFLIKCNCPIVTVCDDWAQWANLGLMLYKIVPRAVAHWNRQTLGSMNDCEQRVKTSGVFWKIKRCIGKPISLIYWRFCRSKIRQAFD